MDTTIHEPSMTAGEVDIGAHYLLTVKANQPTLLNRCARLAWHCVPVLERTRDPARPLTTLGIIPR